MNDMRLFSFIVTLLLVTAGGLPTNGQVPANADQPVLIVLEDVPLPDVVRNLARQANMNFILDPAVASSSIDASGKLHRPPNVTKRLENKTARAALEEILKEHKLVLIENPATTVYRITFADRGAKPVTAAQVIGDTNKINLILDDIPLADAAQTLATSAGLKVEFSAISGAPGSSGRPTPQLFVSLRWENLSPAQALAAVVDAYDLQTTPTADGKTYRISPKPKPENKSSSPQPAQNPGPAK